ncbi:lysine-specific demethylase 4A-like [Metopolophium dirhodum]|uniref:lysine-specific demethylase 4A-like n=1 Tax=Metopolophium dirhodum TaxID=44670 RepID=UPI00298F6440|nr:lysine-specific demethylase 4A-like [Metopolophium dirhodum]
MYSDKDTYEIMVFRPTLTEFKNFSSYIERMEKHGAHRAGLAKVIPPPEWRARRMSYYEDDIMSLKIPAPISQVAQGNQGLYQQLYVQNKPMTVSDYKILAESDEFKTPDYFNYDDLERKFWKNIIYKPPLYGADVSGSIMDKDVGVWNINTLDTILDYVIEDYGVRTEGVNTAYLYFGMWKSSFAWQTEDMNLYSIYYIHEGYPKTWYTIPPEHGHHFESLATDFFPTEASNCPAFLKHKTTVISPDILKQNSIPFNKITQKRGEFIITFPLGYHLGFDHGFNMVECTNFASPRWVEYGKRASQCDCRKEVKICMDTFVKRIQPEKYELWLEKNNIGPHPKDTSATLEAPLTSKSNILCNKNNTSIPKHNIKAGRKRCHETLPSDSDLPKYTTYANKAIDVPSVQKLDKKEYEDEPLNDKQKEVMENILLKADEIDVTEVSYNNGKSRLLNKNHSVLEEITFTSGPGYCNGSDKRSGKQIKYTRLETIKNPEFKNKKNSKSTEKNVVASDQTINRTGSTIISFKENDHSIEKVMTISPISVESLNSMNINRITEESRMNKCINKSIKDSTVFDKTLNNDHLLSKKCDSVNDNTHLNVVVTKSLPPSKLEKSRSSSVTISKTHMILKNQPSNMTSIFMTQTKKKIDLESTRNFFQPTLGPMQSKEEKHEIDGIQNNISDMVNCSFEVERLYNIYRSMDGPHCSICMMLNHKKLTFNLDWQIMAKSFVLPTLNKPTIVLFLQALSGSDEILKEKLIRCEKCFLTVHEVCYGITIDTSSHWLCDRCMKNPRLVACVYCPLKGGALKEFKINEWSHVECHLFVHGSSPLTTNTFSTYFLTNQKCVICNLTSGNCFRCSGSSCCAQFHISCGIFAGYAYQIHQKRNHITLIHCNNHSYIPDKNKIVHINQKVWARHLQHKRISVCRIVKIDKTPLGIVKFSDGTISDNIKLKDIKNYANNFPPIDKIIHLKSGDKGLFLGLNYKHIYSVEYKDGAFGFLLPHDIYIFDKQIYSSLQW